MKAIGIFCSAASDIDSMFFGAAREVGTWMAREGITLVYGGVAMGLMEAVARAVKDGGGHIVGIVPNRLAGRGIQSRLPDETLLCDTLAERKQLMVERSDLLVALPGGIGTLDEVFHTIGGATIGEHRKRVVLYNVGGFWDDCLAMLRRMNSRGFIRGSLDDYLTAVTSIDELAAIKV